MKEDRSDYEEEVLSDCLSESEVYRRNLPTHNDQFYEFVNEPEEEEDEHEEEEVDIIPRKSYNLRQRRPRMSESNDGKKVRFKRVMSSDEEDELVQVKMLRPVRRGRIRKSRYMRRSEFNRRVNKEESPYRATSSPSSSINCIARRKSPRRLREVCYNENILFNRPISDDEKIVANKENINQTNNLFDQSESDEDCQDEGEEDNNIPVNRSKSLRNTIPISQRIAGMDEYLKKLKEMIVFPLLYPEMFASLGISPPRGVLFHGPPGTGKTLLARLLAESCIIPGSNRRVSFFMKNGSDCLSKWIGEAEKNLRKLFMKAKEQQPSIIFFDEIDGLAPERSGKQDQGHISLVATLLALMDGLDDRGNVVVIGATNRINSLDVALRRPGRFDREFYFDLPSKETRRDILQLHTSNWKPKLSEEVLDTLAEQCVDYAGADLKSLCVEAALKALRRSCPNAYELDSTPPSASEITGVLKNLTIGLEDFQLAFRDVIPNARRRQSMQSMATHPHKCLLERSITNLYQLITENLSKNHFSDSWITKNIVAYIQPIVMLCERAGHLSDRYFCILLNEVSKHLPQLRITYINILELISCPAELLKDRFIEKLPSGGGIMYFHGSVDDVDISYPMHGKFISQLVRSVCYSGGNNLAIFPYWLSSLFDFNIKAEWEIEISSSDVAAFVEAHVASQDISSLLHRIREFTWRLTDIEELEICLHRLTNDLSTQTTEQKKLALLEEWLMKCEFIEQ